MGADQLDSIINKVATLYDLCTGNITMGLPALRYISALQLNMFEAYFSTCGKHLNSNIAPIYHRSAQHTSLVEAVCERLLQTTHGEDELMRLTELAKRIDANEAAIGIYGMGRCVWP